MSTIQAAYVRKADERDVTAVSAALSQAFQDDPVFAWVVPDADRRRRALPSFFELFTRTYLRHDEVYVAGDADGAALWVPAGVAPVPEDEADAFGARVVEISGPDAARMAEIDEIMTAHHPHEAHAYLHFLGVVPRSQGRGVGSTLMAPVLERCDADGTPAYLEATTTRNRDLYERHGFRTVGEIVLPDGPPLFPMWREPAGS